MTNQAIDRANELFSAYAGILKASQALALGIAPRTVYAMRDAGLHRLSKPIFSVAFQFF
jgi:hypothetical protein